MTKKQSTDLTIAKSADWPILAHADGGSIMATLSEMGVNRFDLTKISAPAGGATAFEVEGLTDTEYVKELDLIIGHTAANQRSWFRLSLEDGDGGQAPDCSSTDGSNGIGCVTMDPAEESGSHDCATCPHNQFGTADSGRGKACSEKMLLFAFTSESMVPVVIQVAATSLKAMRQYAVKLVGHGRKLHSLVTRITLVKKDSPMPHSVMQFSYVGDLDSGAAEKMKEVALDLAVAFAPKPSQDAKVAPRSVELD